MPNFGYAGGSNPWRLENATKNSCETIKPWTCLLNSWGSHPIIPSNGLDPFHQASSKEYNAGYIYMNVVYPESVTPMTHNIQLPQMPPKMDAIKIVRPNRNGSTL